VTSHPGDPARPRAADEAALRRLVETYAALIDRREGEALRGLFTNDATFVVPEVAGMGGRTLHVQSEFPTSLGAYLRTLHAIVGFVVEELDGDGAAATTSCIAHHVTEGDDRLRNSVWGFRYRDRFRLTGGRWLFDSRSLEVDWIEEREVASVRADGGWVVADGG